MCILVDTFIGVQVLMEARKGLWIAWMGVTESRQSPEGMLGHEVRSSVRALSHWAVFLAPQNVFHNKLA